MTDEVKAHDAAPGRGRNGEGQHPDPYGLYRRWFDVLGGGPSEAMYGGAAGSKEFEGLWERWFEAIRPGGGSGAGAEGGFTGGFAGGMAPLWEKMSGELREAMLSGEGTSENPVGAFLEWYRANGERWAEAADKLLRKEEVLESSGRFFESYARSHGEFRRLSEEGLKSLHIPTRSDVARVAKLVVVVENKVDGIEEAFGEFIHGDAKPATSGDVHDLRERMDRLEEKMNRILGALEEIGGAKPPDEANGRGSSAEGSEQGEET